MYDFLKIVVRETKTAVIIEPKFKICRSSDLMIRGGDFYAVWLEGKGLWSLDELDVVNGVDRCLAEFYEQNRDKYELPVVVKYMWDSDSGSIDKWHKYCQRQTRDNYHLLDEKIIFSNMDVTKEDYASKKLSYPLAEGDHSSWDQIVSTLYSDEERHKIEWGIGSIVSGDSKDIQKFMVFYGSAGTGKGTILKIIGKMFEGYCAEFDAKSLGSANSPFALEPFKNNPLVAIQYDGKLNKIEDNTRINSLVSHEPMTMNEKFKSAYSMKFNAFLLMGTNDPVKITDAKSGLLRRLIDVTPSGEKIPVDEYNRLTKQVYFELGAIAQHCLNVYLEDPHFYNNYVPVKMMSATNDFYNFIEDSYLTFKRQDGTTMKAAWEMYKAYCEDAKVPYPYTQRAFKEELKNYFTEHHERYVLEDGTRVRNYYIGFIEDKFQITLLEEDKPSATWIELKEQHSLLDDILKDLPAQYPRKDGEGLSRKWENCKTKTKDLDTSKLHHIWFPKEMKKYIFIDFDYTDANGNKDTERNIREASKWPKTYCEVSKGGGLHLHYEYTGDPLKLSRVYDDKVEIKVMVGDSSLRRKLTKCNDIPIAKISSGLPLKKETKMVNSKQIENEKHLRALIKKALYREIEPGHTKTCIQFISKVLEEAEEEGLDYDVSDLYQQILFFAMQSSNSKDFCIKEVSKMKLRSDKEPESGRPSFHEKIVFYDVEVFPNLLLVCWKFAGENEEVHTMINPSPTDIQYLLQFRLIGFNNRKYDNHIIYATLIGYSPEQTYALSQRIINGDKDNNPYFKFAYNLSYTDIYDFSSDKKSLKKFEIELGIHHQELGLPWDQPVPENMWDTVADYCKNDVLATEAVFNSPARQADFIARQVLADVTGLTPNDTTNTLSTKFIFGNNKNPQSEFNYRNMGEPDFDLGSLHSPDGYDRFTLFNADGTPVFPGYVYDWDVAGKRKISLYRNEEVGEGGYVYAEPGIYRNVALLDIASMHPSSIIAETLFGKVYTARFEEILKTRLAIKHKDFDKARTMLDGCLDKYLTDESSAKSLAQALKIVINSVYGLTSAKFDNPFRDKRNEDNIVAKRGALFMINLKHEVQKRGFTVAHIKTDSIKIPNATPEIIKFVQEYGKMYGYNFEHEATYDRMCLINDAVYIAKYSDDAYNEHPGEWTATGKQFQVPYVFKKLFSKEDVVFEDMCITNSVSSAMYILRGDPENKKNYKFIGKVGSFCPMVNGSIGGKLVRESKDKNGNEKYDSVAGTKGYEWIEAETIKGTDYEADIDRSYFNKLVDDAVDVISQYGDFTAFCA